MKSVSSFSSIDVEEFSFIVVGNKFLFAVSYHVNILQVFLRLIEATSGGCSQSNTRFSIQGLRTRLPPNSTVSC